jgi:hypothetical protein
MTPAMEELNAAIRNSMKDGQTENVSKIIKDNDCATDKNYAYRLLKFYREELPYIKIKRGRNVILVEKENHDYGSVCAVDGLA